MLNLRIQTKKHRGIGLGAEFQPLAFARSVRNEAPEFSETASAMRFFHAQGSQLTFGPARSKIYTGAGMAASIPGIFSLQSAVAGKVARLYGSSSKGRTFWIFITV